MDSIRFLISAKVLLVCLSLVAVFTAFLLWVSYDLEHSANKILDIVRRLNGRDAFNYTVGEREELAAVSGKFAKWTRIIPWFYLPPLIVYLVWVFCAHARLERLETANLRFSSGWAVGYHFVPFWNLIRPCQIMNEIWKGSDPLAPTPNDCGRKRFSYLVFSWWAVWLSSVFFGWYLFYQYTSNYGSQISPKGISQAAGLAVATSQFVRYSLINLFVPMLLLALLVWTVERRAVARRKIIQRMVNTGLD